MNSRPLQPFDVVVIPFPYTDHHEKAKRRPAIILSRSIAYPTQTGKLIGAMITSSEQEWPHDVAITHWKAAGLDVPCIIRMKLFTLEQAHIIRRLGSLKPKDREALISALREALV